MKSRTGTVHWHVLVSFAAKFELEDMAARVRANLPHGAITADARDAIVMELAREKTQLDRARKLAKIEDLIKREEDVCAVLCKPATCARRVRKITCLCLLCVWCGTTVGFFLGGGGGLCGCDCRCRLCGCGRARRCSACDPTIRCEFVCGTPCGPTPSSPLCWGLSLPTVCCWH